MVLNFLQAFMKVIQIHTCPEQHNVKSGFCETETQTHLSKLFQITNMGCHGGLVVYEKPLPKRSNISNLNLVGNLWCMSSTLSLSVWNTFHVCLFNNNFLPTYPILETFGQISRLKGKKVYHYTDLHTYSAGRLLVCCSCFFAGRWCSLLDVRLGGFVAHCCRQNVDTSAPSFAFNRTSWKLTPPSNPAPCLSPTHTRETFSPLGVLTGVGVWFGWEWETTKRRLLLFWCTSHPLNLSDGLFELVEANQTQLVIL